jgi:hypothetical protein
LTGARRSLKASGLHTASEPWAVSAVVGDVVDAAAAVAVDRVVIGIFLHQETTTVLVVAPCLTTAMFE